MKTKIKILYICKSAPDSFQGGIQTHTWQLAHQMGKMGHRVSILTAGTAFKKTNRIASGENVELIRLSYLPGRFIPVFWLFLEEFLFNLAVLIWVYRHSSEFDVIHLQGRSGYLLPYFIKTKKIACTSHGLLLNEYQAGRKFGFRLASFLHYHFTKSFEKQGISKSHLIAVSESLKTDISNLFELQKPTEVINNGVELSENETVIPNSMDLLFVGRIEYAKGIFDLLEAMQKVSATTQLKIAGDGSAREELIQHLKKDATLNSRVSYLGAQDKDQIKRLIDQSFALVLPSYRETQGIVILEANSQGKPALASNIDGINEILHHGENGLLFEAGNPESIAAMINNLINQPKKAVEMGQKGKEMVNSKFSWEKIANQTLSFYHQQILAL